MSGMYVPGLGDIIYTKPPEIELTGGGVPNLKFIGVTVAETSRGVAEYCLVGEQGGEQVRISVSALRAAYVQALVDPVVSVPEVEILGGKPRQDYVDADFVTIKAGLDYLRSKINPSPEI